MIPPDPFHPDREEVEKWLREALNHLYDVGYLENHPLGALLVRPDESTGKRGQDLRKVLVTAIQARKPPRGAPSRSPDWRGYQILEQHILGGLSPAEVSQKLNISRSLFFLEKARILKVVLDELWAARIEARLAIPVPLPAAPLVEPSEAQRLLESAVFEPVELRELLSSIRPLLEPLAKAQGARLSVTSSGEEILPRGERVLLRQVILSLVGELLHLVPGGEIHITSFAEAGTCGIQIEAHKALDDTPLLRLEERRGLAPETARELVRVMGGRLTVDVTDADLYRALLSWPLPRRARRLLLVDDHPDLADLFTRCLAGTGWEITWAASAEKARQILAEMRQRPFEDPAMIVLDVILPHEDGWEFLISLKGDALTRDIPVLVCSAINEPDLVHSLGAQGYLPKPFSAAQLIQALGALS